MTSSISPASAGFPTPRSPSAPAGAKASLPAVGLTETEEVLAGILGSGSTAGSGDIFSLGAGRARAGVDLAQMLTGTSTADPALTPDAQVAQVRQEMIGTLLDLKK